MTNKEFKELEELLTRECPKYESDCTTCPYSNDCDRYAKVAETENSVIIATVGNLTADELTYDNILYIASFYGISTEPDKFHYHMITADGAAKKGCKLPIRNYNEFIEYFKN